jgi:hypothetical protein
MEVICYVLCAVTAAVCSLLMFRGYSRSRTRLLLWCGLFFAALALENTFLFIDYAVGPHLDLSFTHRATALVGVAIFLYGLIWDVK